MNARHEAILEVAEQLLARHGSVPTVEAVREALGGGSFSTISPVLREWRNQQRITSVTAGDIPPKVKEALEQASAALWGTFREEIEERVAREQEAAQKRSEEATGERDEALREVARLEALLEEERSKAQTERESLRVERDEARQNLAVAREEVATFKERTRQLEGQVQGLRDELAAERQRTDALTADNARLQERAGYVDELKEQVKALQDRLAAPVNQNQLKAPAKARPRKKGGQGGAE